MQVKIPPRWLTGELNAIQSKSHLHRLLIANSLSNPKYSINVRQISDDIGATIESLSSLESPLETNINCNESGSTLRFLLPITMALKDKANFFGNGRLPNRPLGELKSVMEAGGSVFSGNPKASYMFTVEGGLRSGIYNIPGNVSSQYITGLLFALPLVSGESKLIVSKPIESVGYVNMTLQVLDIYGIRIFLDKISDNNNVIFTIPGDQP